VKGRKKDSLIFKESWKVKGRNYLPHLPLAAHLLAAFLALSPEHLPDAEHLLAALSAAHLPDAEHFDSAAASAPFVHPVNPSIAKPINAVKSNFFILIS